MIWTFGTARDRVAAASSIRPRWMGGPPGAYRFRREMSARKKNPSARWGMSGIMTSCLPSDSFADLSGFVRQSGRDQAAVSNCRVAASISF